MQFGHGKLDVHPVSIQSVARAYEVAECLKGIDRHARDRLLRASQSIPFSDYDYDYDNDNDNDNDAKGIP